MVEWRKVNGKSMRIPQSAALPYRRGRRGLEVLLITSRETRRWVLPKGGIMPGMTPYESAAEEAFEEAGIAGRVDRRCIGVYGYRKLRDKGMPYCTVRVYPMKVNALYADWPERRERQRKWMTFDAASARVRERGLKKILTSFHTSQRRRRGWRLIATPDRSER
jgi:8-oxo-dGTP pyrophosphatase MutT (NUDIX family)